MTPFLSSDAGAAGLGVALAVGVAFGWCLERAGLGSARKLAGQFYGRDFTVLKVLFSAIVTAMLGAFWLARLGVLDPARVYVPQTWLLPQAVGGALFGVGMVAGGLCPGTSCVAAAAGRRDGLAVMGGMLAGVLLFAAAFPLLRRLYDSTPAGTLTLPDLLRLPAGTVVAGVVAMALGAFAIAEWFEQRAALRAEGAS
ncbi:MAG TPA: YeeE/YedE thiosulfate transporter family protein [Longimicrobium sp.]|nr:YeeE/YedE thiosulfate transporter family protein [Longimicrobium sp.]